MIGTLTESHLLRRYTEELKRPVPPWHNRACTQGGVRENRDGQLGRLSRWQ